MDTAENVTPLRIADARRAIRHVFIRDLLLQAEIGVYSHEHGKTQPVRINVDLTVSEDAHADNLDKVVCYRGVTDKIKDLIAGRHVKLVETLGEAIAETCLEDPRVLVARIRVEKLAAIAEAASVGVEIERVRDDRC